MPLPRFLSLSLEKKIPHPINLLLEKQTSLFPQVLILFLFIILPNSLFIFDSIAVSLSLSYQKKKTIHLNLLQELYNLSYIDPLKTSDSNNFY